MTIDWKTISLENLAGFLSEALRKHGIKTILVGGACVTIHSHNRYQSHDLDFIIYEDMRKVQNALFALGFHVQDRYFVHDDCPWFVEFVSPPVAIGNEPINQFENKITPFGTIQMLRPVDSVKDRLAGYFHWNDRQSLMQAVDICLETTLDLSEVKRWSAEEGFPDKYQDFLNLLAKQKSKSS